MALPGFMKFRVSEKELISLLKSKNYDPQIESDIPEINLSESDPCQISGLLGDSMPVFFSRRESFHGKGKQFKRKTKSGTWKSTGKRKEIADCDGESVITMRYMVHSNKAGEKSGWVIHEYALNLNTPLQNQGSSFVICCLFRKSAKKTKNVMTPEIVEHGHSGVNPFEHEYSCVDEGVLSSNDTSITGTPVEGIDCVSSDYDWMKSYSPHYPFGNHMDYSGGNPSSVNQSTVTLEVDDGVYKYLSEPPLYSPGHNDDPASYGLTESEASYYDSSRHIHPHENQHGTAFNSISDDYNQLRASEEILHDPYGNHMDYDRVYGNLWGSFA